MGSRLSSSGGSSTTDASALTTGTLPLARLSGITTSQLDAAAGITSAQIAALDAAKITTGTLPLARLSGITTSQLSASAALVAGQIASVNPSALTGTGTVPLAGLSGITTAQLSASAALVAGQIASVNPSALTGSGTVPLAGLSGITTTQLSASAGIVAGQLAVSAPSAGQLGGVTTSNLSASAGLVAGQIASVNPSALTGSGTVPLAGLSGITTSQLAAGAAITSGQIASVAAATITGTNTLPDGVLSTNVPLLNAANAFTAAQTITSPAAATKPLIVKGAASQSADLQQWQNTSGTVLAKVVSDGTITSTAGFNGNLYANPYVVDTTNAGPFLTFSPTTLLVSTRAAANIGLIVKGAGSQTADLQQWQSSAAAVLLKVDSSGAIAPQNGARLTSGSGVPTTPGSLNPTAGDIYYRTDTPSTANQRMYCCTVGGGSPTWVGIA